MTQHPQQTASKMCDNFLEELHDLLKEFGDSEDYRFVEAVVDLHERVLLWKQRPDVCATHTPEPAAVEPICDNSCKRKHCSRKF